jgi:geranylgeranylglycerol-phosphate geranylgeranyltransferase
MEISAIPRLMRIENCAMAGVAVAIGYVVAGGLGINLGIILAVISAFLITGAGNAVNDYYDKEVDKKNAPKRPIPSGLVSARGAFFLALSLFGIGIVMSFFINHYCLALASFNSLLLFFYARDLKGTIFIGNVAVSYLTASTFIYGALVLVNPLTTMFLALLAFLANVGREIIGDIEDIEGDRKAGLKTLAIKIGRKKSWWYGTVYILTAVVLSPIPYLMGLLGAYYLMTVLLADAVFVESILTRDARKNQKLTKMAIFLGLAAFLVGALV